MMSIVDSCSSMYTARFLTTVDGWSMQLLTLRVWSASLSLASWCCMSIQIITSDFDIDAFSFGRCELLYCWISSTQSITACLAAWTSSVCTDPINWASSAKLSNTTPSISVTSCSSDAYSTYSSDPHFEPYGTLEPRSMISDVCKSDVTKNVRPDSAIR